MPDYHSVYLEPDTTATPAARFRLGESTAFVHDILDGPTLLPAEYDGCDVLYADLPWRAGFDRYNQRAGIEDGRTYRTFLTTVADIITACRRPAVLISGRHAAAHLPKPTQTVDIAMPVANRQPATAYLYNLSMVPDWDDMPALLARLAAMYSRVGDFCCGYGWSARAFHRAGKTFVASDFNPQCIGYIAANAPGWDRG